MSQQKRPLTDRQQEVYDWIVEYIDDFGYAPSYRDIAEGIGCESANAAHMHVTALEKKGWIERDGGKLARGLRVVGSAEKAPLLKTIRKFDLDTLKQIVRRYGP